MDARRFGEAGLVGWRGRLGADASRWLSERTPLREETLRTLVGGYLFLSRARRMAQMLGRLRG